MNFIIFYIKVYKEYKMLNIKKHVSFLLNRRMILNFSTGL